MRQRMLPFVCLALLAARPVAAQGTLSGQGFGFPMGGLSARAAALGGAAAEFDHVSGRNPAAVRGWGRSGLYAQFDPEQRTLTTATGDDRTSVARFGAIAAGFAVGSRVTVSVSSHSYLDRTWTTSIRSGQRLGGDSVGYTERFSSRGGIGDKRLAVGVQLHRTLAVGAGLHLFSGENRLALQRQFDDSVRFGTLSRDLTLSYSGAAASGGVVFTPFKALSIAGSVRQGGTMRLRVVDTLRTQATVPSRYGGAVRLDVIPGLVLMASADREAWSKLNGLGSTSARAADGWDYGAGVESAGQKVRSAAWSYALGYRRRDLPFAAAGLPVREQSLGGGFSAPLAGPRAILDVAVLRARRTAGTLGPERAWQLSAGVAIRP